jgi:hypothetical protein
MPLGAGACPVGSSAAGYGVPDRAFAPNNAMLPGIRTGLSQSGRFIDPTTKSYAFQADGRLKGVSTVPQLVQIALSTVLGSSAVATLGQTFSLIAEKGPDYQRRVTSAIESALANVVKQRLVQIVSVDVQLYPAAPDAGVATLKWRDLTTGIVNVNSIGP